MTSGSSLVGKGELPFDFETQRGIAHVLASVRASTLDSILKNELRDLIFLYANGGRDQSVRLTLEQKLTACQVQALAVPEHPSSGPGAIFHPFGGDFRTDPTFFVEKSIPTTTYTPAPSTATIPPPSPLPTASYSAPQIVAQATSMPTQAPTPQTIPATPVIPPIMTAQPPVVTAYQSAAYPPVPNNIPTSTPVFPVITPTQPSAVPYATPVPPSTPFPQSVSTPVVGNYSVPTPSVPPIPMSTSDQEQTLMRIRDIKARVNEKVGNPVNLVDIDNVVGREYMAALLDAMKKLNSGSSVVAAMQRLEAAFVQVEGVLANYAKQSIVPPPASPLPPAPVAAPTPPVVPTVSTPIPNPVIVSSTPVYTPPPLAVPVATPATVVPVNLPIASPESNPQVPAFPVAVSVTLPPASSPVAPFDLATPKPSFSVDTSVTSTPAVSVKMPVPVKLMETAVLQPSAIPIQPEKRFTSLAESDIKLRTPSDLPTEAEKFNANAAADPLYAPEVDEGLQQLLVEWKIFKKSGLFGTGPKGRAHPLFIKLAKLQIPLILAGRFEGSTQEIKQSITDYMNGWRYEQGIIYEQGEVFEHYLRRIIRHILNLQQRRKSS